ncbi:RICIN domain-containing protein [Saccharothrix sp. S26]|uniref:RICIN domain-containing protein n=1 Tax=Saccharothrix sp. S26 TaxID=2907215 RepID=UPI001F34D07B|nr:ricin-type beta-trefoil lectin domain protein [Saccharothrix sp. S26]MCE6995370.1 RICIN domain-containing protein [Saccharothrix sp. S26]
MGLKGKRIRLVGVGAAVAFGSTLLAGTATTAQAAPVYYQVINANGINSCLQVNISGGKGNLVLGNCDRSAKQVWTISGGIFRNPVSGHCLDGNGADVYTFPCNGGAYQKWTTISSTSKKSIRHDWSGKFLDGNGALGANVVFQPSIETASRWVIDQV